MKFCLTADRNSCKEPLTEAPTLHAPRPLLLCVLGQPIPVVAAIVELDGMVILARNRLWPEKMFGLVTGFLEGVRRPRLPYCAR